jgi:hypothetical protein
MAISPLAGKPAPNELLIDVARLEREYFERQPDLSDPNQRVSFGTSGHRGTPCYPRLDAPATPEQKARLQQLSAGDIKKSDLSGKPITAKLNVTSLPSPYGIGDLGPTAGQQTLSSRQTSEVLA